MMKRIAIAVTPPLMMMFCILFPSLVTAETCQFCVMESGEITVLFDDSLERAARTVAKIYPELMNELEERIGWRPDKRITVALISDHDTFKSIVGVDYVVAVAVPSKQLVVVDYMTAAARPFSLKTILKHELCHLLLHEKIESGRLPRWLDEGIAQWASGGISEIAMKRDPFLVSRAVRTGNTIPLRMLERSFPGNEQAILSAYEESKSVVEFIIQKFGPEGLRSLIEELRLERNIEEAVQRALGISLDELEYRWHGHVKERGTWVSFWSYYMYEVVFVLGALLSVAAFLQYLRRKRTCLNRADDDENDL